MGPATLELSALLLLLFSAGLWSKHLARKSSIREQNGDRIPVLKNEDKNASNPVVKAQASAGDLKSVKAVESPEALAALGNNSR